MNRNVVLIIQARMGSSRLPGKSMMDLAGEPLVGRILERVKKCKSVNEIVLAIPNTIENEVLHSLGKTHKVSVFAGSENNLLERYYNAALKYNADIIVRLPADNATPEASEIDRIIEYHLSLNKPGFSSNLAEIYNSGYPDGIGAEVFDFTLLEDAINRNPNNLQLEHVHLNFFDYSNQQARDNSWCPVNTLQCPKDFSRPDIVLDVNTYDQYLFIKQLYEDLYSAKPNFNIIDIINWYDNIWSKKTNDNN
jgi:spore coat polysaccharide biosynthesis protein SpsF